MRPRGAWTLSILEIPLLRMITATPCPSFGIHLLIACKWRGRLDAYSPAHYLQGHGDGSVQDSAVDRVLWGMSRRQHRRVTTNEWGVSRRRLRSLPGPREHWEFTRWSAERIGADQFADSDPFLGFLFLSHGGIFCSLSTMAASAVGGRRRGDRSRRAVPFPPVRSAVSTLLRSRGRRVGCA